MGPGDLVLVYDPGNQGEIDWSGPVKPGMTGVVLSEAYWADPPPFSIAWCRVHDVRFPHMTSSVAELLLKKIRPPPIDETLPDEELMI